MESSGTFDDYFQLFLTSLIPILSAFMQFAVGAFICYSQLLTEDQARGISTLMIKIFNPLYVVGIVGAAIDFNSISVLPVFAFNMAATILFGYLLGSFAVEYCRLSYFKNTIRAMVMFQNYFVLPTIILQETCASYGFLAGNGRCNEAIMFIGLYMAINNLITNAEVSKAIQRDLKKRLQEMPADPLLHELKLLKYTSSVEVCHEIEKEKIKEFRQHKETMQKLSVPFLPLSREVSKVPVGLNQGPEHQEHKEESRIKQLFHEVQNRGTLACCIGLFIALNPEIKSLFFSHSSHFQFLGNFLLSAGKFSLPLSNFAIGYWLWHDRNSELKIGKEEILSTVLCKLAIMPVIGICMLFIVNLISPSGLKNDHAWLYAQYLQWLTPTGNTIVHQAARYNHCIPEVTRIVYYEVNFLFNGT